MDDSPSESTRAGLLQMIQQNDEKHEAAHKRLRETLRDLGDTVDSNFRHFEDQNNLVRSKLNEVSIKADTPVDATKLVLSSKAIIAVVLASVTIAASYWNLSTKLDAQQRATEASAKLEEVQMKALGDAAADAKATAADAKRQYELLRYEFQSLKEIVQKKDK
jgi:hypothetical protein